MTQQEKNREIYWELYFCLSQGAEVTDGEDWGMCHHLRELRDIPNCDPAIADLYELLAQKPPKAETYWWNCNDQGLRNRKNAVLRAIELTYKTTDNGTKMD